MMRRRKMNIIFDMRLRHPCAKGKRTVMVSQNHLYNSNRRRNNMMMKIMKSRIQWLVILFSLIIIYLFSYFLKTTNGQTDDVHVNGKRGVNAQEVGDEDDS